MGWKDKKKAAAHATAARLARGQENHSSGDENLLVKVTNITVMSSKSTQTRLIVVMLEESTMTARLRVSRSGRQICRNCMQNSRISLHRHWPVIKPWSLKASHSHGPHRNGGKWRLTGQVSELQMPEGRSKYSFSQVQITPTHSWHSSTCCWRCSVVFLASAPNRPCRFLYLAQFYCKKKNPSEELILSSNGAFLLKELKRSFFLKEHKNLHKRGGD